jgi:serine/threonine-protein kinase
VPNITSVNGADDDTKNTAVKQDPTGGTRVDPRSTVKVEINVGPKQATIPEDLVGKKAKKVERLLEAAGFDPDNIKREDAQQPEPLDAKKGDVLAIDPQEGSTVAADSEITLTVATGKSQVPNLMGKQADAAEQDAENAGFHTQVKTVIDNDNPEGIVVSQSYSEGTLVERGTTIVISVAKHSEPSPSPTPTPTGPATSSTSPSPTPGKPGGKPGG